jgi:hypothetical protein
MASKPSTSKTHSLCNTPFFRGNLPRSGRGAKENLIPARSPACQSLVRRAGASAKAGREHQLVSILKNNHKSARTVRLMVNVTHTIKNIDHPLDKILKGIPVGSTDSTPASVTHCFTLESFLGFQ